MEVGSKVGSILLVSTWKKEVREGGREERRLDWLFNYETFDKFHLDFHSSLSHALKLTSKINHRAIHMDSEDECARHFLHCCLAAMHPYRDFSGEVDFSGEIVFKSCWQKMLPSGVSS